MYNNSGFSMKSVIIQFLFVALFVFILVWLFPTKNDLTSLIITDEESDYSVLLDRIYIENIILMKDGAKAYYTDERLPQVVGDTVKLTLEEMLELHIVLPFTDKHGDTCSMDESYVEITKYENEYVMKVRLKCGEEDNYLLVYMGCYTYCTSPICEKNTSDIDTPVIYPSVDYLYEYLKTTDGYWTVSNWSAWQEEVVTPSSTVEVKIKTDTIQKLIGYNVTTSTDYSKPIYDTVTIVIGTRTSDVCTEYGYVETGSTISDYTLVGYSSTPGTETSTDTWRAVAYNSSITCDDCSAGLTTVYAHYKISYVPETEYHCVNYETQTVDITQDYEIIVDYESSETSREPVYEYYDIQYYSYRTKTYIEGTKDLKWSTYNDSSLLNSGYNYTGNKKEQ